MIKLDEHDLREFADLWRAEFGEEITAEEARHHASQLLELCLLLVEPPDDDALPQP